jgi:hypothetical protein
VALRRSRSARMEGRCSSSAGTTSRSPTTADPPLPAPSAAGIRTSPPGRAATLPHPARRRRAHLAACHERPATHRAGRDQRTRPDARQPSSPPARSQLTRIWHAPQETVMTSYGPGGQTCADLGFWSCGASPGFSQRSNGAIFQDTRNRDHAESCLTDNLRVAPASRWHPVNPRRVGGLEHFSHGLPGSGARSFVA